MPYIEKQDRGTLNNCLKPLLDYIAVAGITAGELNYCITKLVRAFLGDAFNYTRLNSTVGVLECAKLELYRRMVAPYEDRKCAENGDVYDG